MNSMSTNISLSAYPQLNETAVMNLKWIFMEMVISVKNTIYYFSVVDL